MYEQKAVWKAKALSIVQADPIKYFTSKTTTELITSIHFLALVIQHYTTLLLLSTVPGVSDFASLAVSVSFASFEMSGRPLTNHATTGSLSCFKKPMEFDLHIVLICCSHLH